MRIRKVKQSALVVCSGGVDSVTALYWAKRRYKRVEAITFNYGANHNKRERAGLRAVCAHSATPLTIVTLPLGRYFKSSLLSGANAIPEGHYAEENMKSTVVPFRNGIMLSFAAGFAESNGFDAIVLGNHGGDHAIYPDCRREFIDAIASAIKAGTWAGVKVVSPFCDWTKADIVRLGARLGVPYGLTYSCYKGGRKHCGKCGTCVERKEAFALAGVDDPTEYEG
jgi:7-cyano-7-deazaguanine synthase